MNFDTKYLIRWGVPGWIMMMSLIPYFYVANYEKIQQIEELKGFTAPANLIAIAAILTVLGVPLGYLLNQISHSIVWVFLRHNKSQQYEYFYDEILRDEWVFSDGDKGKSRHERYRYLLSRKHELSALVTSLVVSLLFIAMEVIIANSIDKWKISYISILFVLLIIVINSYVYSSRNIEAYTRHYTSEAHKSKRKKTLDSNNESE